MGPVVDTWMQLSTETLQREAKVPVRIVPDRPGLYAAFAREIADEIKAHNTAGNPTVLILPVGPIGQFSLLADICNRERISWQNVWTFNMDEYCDWEGRSIPLDHPLSFEGYMRGKFFARLDPDLRIPDDHVFFPRIERIDEVSETIAELGGVDSCYGGIGIHGHVAFNEPPISRFYPGDAGGVSPIAHARPAPGPGDDGDEFHPPHGRQLLYLPAHGDHYRHEGHPGVAPHPPLLRRRRLAEGHPAHLPARRGLHPLPVHAAPRTPGRPNHHRCRHRGTGGHLVPARTSHGDTPLTPCIFFKSRDSIQRLFRRHVARGLVPRWAAVRACPLRSR